MSPAVRGAGGRNRARMVTAESELLEHMTANNAPGRGHCRSRIGIGSVGEPTSPRVPPAVPLACRRHTTDEPSYRRNGDLSESLRACHWRRHETWQVVT